jgi:molybdopterin-binding protein
VNQLTAVVTSIDETDVVTYIHLGVGETKISVINSKRPEWLSLGDKVNCIFQEVSVSVSNECPGKVSIENRLPATLKEMRQGASLCELTFESDLGEVVSLITSHACELLGLEIGCKATMLLRGIDITLEPILLPSDHNAYRNVLARMKDAN